MLNVGKTSVGFCVIEGGSLQGKWVEGAILYAHKMWDGAGAGTHIYDNRSLQQEVLLG
jgi:hypothetical protein